MENDAHSALVRTAIQHQFRELTATYAPSLKRPDKQAAFCQLTTVVLLSEQKKMWEQGAAGTTLLCSLRAQQPFPAQHTAPPAECTLLDAPTTWMPFALWTDFWNHPWLAANNTCRMQTWDSARNHAAIEPSSEEGRAQGSVQAAGW